MKEMKIVVFEVWGDFAHFRRGYTTTSSLTYPFPPKSTIIGLIAAIIGLPNHQQQDNYYKKFTPEQLKIGLEIINPVKTIIIKENLINTKLEGYFQSGIISTSRGRSQIPIEFLKDPRYRIYTLFDEKLKNERDKLIEFLSQHKSFYTPYLGTAQCIANFEYIGYFEASLPQQNDEKYYEFSSIIPKSIGEIKAEEGKAYGKIRVPTFINERRELEEFDEFIYTSNAKPILLTNLIENEKKYLVVNVKRKNVILF